MLKEAHTMTHIPVCITPAQTETNVKGFRADPPLAPLRCAPVMMRANSTLVTKMIELLTDSWLNMWQRHNIHCTVQQRSNKASPRLIMMTERPSSHKSKSPKHKIVDKWLVTGHSFRFIEWDKQTKRRGLDDGVLLSANAWAPFFLVGLLYHS